MGAPIGVVILGMHRSGTSAVAGMFVCAGFFAGRDDDLMPPSADNPAGYHENLRIHRANERILERLRGSWFDPPDSAAQLGARSSAVPGLRDELERLVGAAEGMPVVLKDPRLGVMMPLWDELIAGRFHPVLVIRDPIEIARSLLQRDGTPTPFGLALWEMHMTMLLAHLHGREVTVVPYAALLSEHDLGSRLVSIATAHIDPIRATRVQALEASEAVRPELRRSKAAAPDHDEQLTIRQQELWDLLSSLPYGDEQIDAPAALRSVSTHARTVMRAETNRMANEATRARLNRELTSEKARTASISAEAERLSAEVQRLAEEEHRLAQDLQRLTTSEQQLDGALQRLTAELDDARRDYLTVINSMRWRVMGPLSRAIAGWRRWQGSH
jgi:hypothetical protein